jgi:hypothetical protein
MDRGMGGRYYNVRFARNHNSQLSASVYVAYAPLCLTLYMCDRSMKKPPNVYAGRWKGWRNQPESHGALHRNRVAVPDSSGVISGIRSVTK